jgi:CRISPR system Cascade subunit CasE
MTVEDYAELQKNDFYFVHMAVWDLFGNKNSERKFLYRVNNGVNDTVILIQSLYPVIVAPKIGNIQCKIISTNLPTGDYQIRATLNPVVDKSRVKEGKLNSAHVPIVKEEDVLRWCANRIEKNGFKVKRLGVSPVIKNYSKTKGATVCTTSVVGVVSVSDVLTAQKAYVEGIGKERSFGCGMLCLVPLENVSMVSDDHEDSDD